MNYKMIIWALVFVLFSSCKKDSKAPEPTDPGTETPEPGTQKREVLVWVDANSNVFGTYGRFSDKKRNIGCFRYLEGRWRNSASCGCERKFRIHHVSE